MFFLITIVVLTGLICGLLLALVHIPGRGSLWVLGVFWAIAMAAGFIDPPDLWWKLAARLLLVSSGWIVTLIVGFVIGHAIDYALRRMERHIAT